MGPIGRDAIRRNQEAVEAARNRPPEVQDKHKREEVGSTRQSPAEELRETINRRDYKPGPEMPGLGNYAGPLQTPQPPRYGDPNFGVTAKQLQREEEKIRQEHQQHQKQER